MLDISPNDYFIFLVGVGVVGLMVGSFLNVVIYRLPIMLKREWEQECLEYLKQNSSIKYKIFNLFTPRSHCPKCETPIAWWQNIPIISYIFLLGKCNYCNNVIHWRYPIIELVSCITSLTVAINFGFTAQTLALLILTWSLIVAIFIDLDHQLLPDNITLPLIWFGLLINSHETFTTAENAIIGAIAGYIFLWLIAYIFKLIRKVDGMGHGDFKLLAVFGAWLGWQLLPIILFVAALIGGIISIILVFREKGSFKKPIAFGPYLAIAGWLSFFYGQAAIDWYLRIFYL
jgi:leader peptidase (prepilin peptidase) / N-methyltransferase